MGNTRDFGLMVRHERDEESRRRDEESMRGINQRLMNQWAFRSACLNNRVAYNGADPAEDATYVDQKPDGA